MERTTRYRRVLLKLSGEAFAVLGSEGVDLDTVEHIADQVAEVHRLDVQIGIVVGGGNIFRGSEGARHGMDRVTADHIGMLGTVINALALKDALERAGVETRVQTAIEMRQIAEPFIRGRALRHLEKGRVVVFGAGDGNPYTTTDTPAALRALEIGADVFLMGKRVRGVFTADPAIDPTAEFLPSITYLEALERDLKVMDATALALCRDHKVPILVFNMLEDGNIKRLVLGERIGTVVSGETATTPSTAGRSGLRPDGAGSARR